MEWLTAETCSGAAKFGWLVGNLSGLYGLVNVVVLIVSAPAYHPELPFVVNKRLRKGSQWLLYFAQLLLFFVWLLGGSYVGAEFLRWYTIAFCIGATIVVAPIMLLIMFTSANWIGRARAR
jgi:hypothetical protein